MSKHIFNPLLKDFVTTYDINEDGHPVTFVARAQEITAFDPIVADHIASHLADEVLNQRSVRTNPVDDKEEILKEIMVIL